MVPVSGATGGLYLGSEEDQGELLARCVPLGGAVGLEITAAEPFSKRFVWSEDHKYGGWKDVGDFVNALWTEPSI